MFDTLTLDQLRDLHQQLAAEHRDTFHKLFDADHGLLIEPGTGLWRVLRAKCAETYEAMTAVYDEMRRREEEARTDA